MEKSALQIARAAYQPKLPKALQGAVKIKEGKATQSVGDQEEIKKLFPNTYGMPIVEFEPATEANTKKMNVGVILSGGQAPGGHNVITGLFDQIKKLNPENRLYGLSVLVVQSLRRLISSRRGSRLSANSTSRLSLLSVVTTLTPTLVCWLSTMLLRTMVCR